MANEKSAKANWLVSYASSLRFPYLFALTAAIFLIDLAVPDFIPLVDEILLALGTLILGTLRDKRKRSPADAPSAPADSKSPTIDIT